ncbi:MAG: amidase [Alphaproteobacteria bacterium]|nr:amidase [Alphaproteobacteria bacterium]
MDDPVGAFVPHGLFQVDAAADGPLAGLTFAAKDIIDVAGHVTGCGNPDWLRTHGPAATTAPCIQRLLDAGATLVGKTVTEELATGLTGENVHYGAPVNVNAPGRVAGGSSSGSAAAVAAGLVDFALGSDTGGSVRSPASFCGLYGLRPSHGRVSLESVMKLAASFDTIGWFARTPEIMRDVGAVIFDEANAPPAPGRLLVARDVMAVVDAATRDALMAAVDKVSGLLGAPEPIDVSNVEGLPGLDAWVGVTRAIWGAESWAEHGEWIQTVNPTFGSGVAARFEARSQVTADQLAVARLQREVVAAHLAQLLAGGNVLALPVAPGIAPLRGGSDADIDPFRERNEPIGSCSGLARLPQISLPLATLDGFPLGLGLAAAPGNDELLLDIAVALAEAGVAPRVPVPDYQG